MMIKTIKIINTVLFSTLLLSSCGSSNHSNNDQEKKYSDTIDEQGNPIYPDTINQDSTKINYRDSTSNAPSGTIPPTSN